MFTETDFNANDIRIINYSQAHDETNLNQFGKAK